MDKPNVSVSPDERREFCRIEDEVALRYRAVTEDDVAGLSRKMQEALPDRFTAAATFAATSQKMAGLLRTIQRDSYELASFLEAIDNKLNMLAQLFVTEELEIDDRPACRVNMSANGMAFHTDTRFETGQLLELRIVLFPSLTGILTIGRVVHCQSCADENEEYPYLVAVEFHNLREEDQDILVKHILTRQLDARRQQRFCEEVLDQSEP